MLLVPCPPCWPGCSHVQRRPRRAPLPRCRHGAVAAAGLGEVPLQPQPPCLRPPPHTARVPSCFPMQRLDEAVAAAGPEDVYLQPQFQPVDVRKVLAEASGGLDKRLVQVG